MPSEYIKRGISDLDANFGCQCVRRDAIFMKKIFLL